MEKIHVLLVEDERTLSMIIKDTLEEQGFRISTAFHGEEGLRMFHTEHPEIVVADVMMPRMDGLSAIMRIRQTKNIPIIVLSAKSEDTDKVLGLSVGADDYISKPYNPMELVARVRASLRRYMHLGTMGEGLHNNKSVITIGGLELDTDNKQLTVDGDGVKLTATEYKILELLMKNPGKIFSAENIYTSVWNEDGYAVENTVMVHIRHLREKIEINPKEPRYIKVVWGLGYKIEEVKG